MQTFRGFFAILMAMLVASPGSVFAANHREAPITALDRAADITDWYAFVSFDDPSKVTFILNVDPLLDPGNGPNYFPFDPDIVYVMRIDNNNDAVEDVSFEFRFQTEIRAPGLFTGFLGVGAGVNSPANAPLTASGATVPPGTSLIPPAITALDGRGSEGFSLRQTYTVTMVTGNAERRQLGGTNQRLIAVPSNVGSRTMPNYPALARQGIYELGNGVRVFAGTVDDPFFIDLGGTFDTLNLRGNFASGTPGVMTAAEDANDRANIGPDSVAGYNVNTIALEVPIAMLVRGGARVGPGDPRATIGTWGATYRPRMTIRREPGEDGGQGQGQGGQGQGQGTTGQGTGGQGTGGQGTGGQGTGGQGQGGQGQGQGGQGQGNDIASFRQIQRMGNPLINEVIIGTGSKDRFSMSQPKDDSQFASFAVDPVLARALNAVYGIKVPDAPRTDLLPLVQYAAPIAPAGTPAGPIADMLRLNTAIAPTPATARKRLGLLGGDNAGWPNGRRLSDDVVDIALRAVAGVLAGGQFATFPYTNIGDGVNANDLPFQETFPYVAFAHSGLRVKVDPPAPAARPNLGSPECVLVPNLCTK